MKEVERSQHSGALLKKKSSSGCLIIKKKVSDGGGRFNDSSSRNLCNSRKEKKRTQVVRSDSESSNEPLEPKIGEFHNGSVVSNLDFGANKDIENAKRVNNEYDVFDERGIRKDVNDEKGIRKDDNDERAIRKDVNDERAIRKDVNDERAIRKDVNDERAIRKDVNDKRAIGKDVNDGRAIGKDVNDERAIRKDVDDERAIRKDVNDERAIRKDVNDERAIRLQGKNGVLKVMVSKHKQTSVVFDNEKLNGEANKKKAVMRSSYNLDSKHPAKSGASKSKEKGELKLPKVATSNKRRYDSELSLQFKNEGTIEPPVKGKESKVKGSVTEKKLLREKIRKMLLGAGWTIDYRPRRNRDYLDAVYINPTGTAYWSIVKAYEALQKEERDQSKAGKDFTHLPDELLSKLTRQTRKKIERELKKKKRDEDCSKKGKRVRVKESGENTDKNYTHKKTKRKSEESNQECGDKLIDNLEKRKPKKDRTLKSCTYANGRCTLLVRSSDKGLISENNGFVPYSGKRTLILWLIDSGTVHMNEKVEYMNLRRTRVMQEGWITKDGIQCGCCSKILTVSRFELHAGSKLRQPFLNVFLQSGKSLMQCQIDAWNKQRASERKSFHDVDVNGDDPNDDTCGLCGDGGDLICCDGCPSTFHQSCLSLQMLPQGDWHCPNCSCKYYEVAGWNCTEANDRTESPLPMCCLCEKKYHESCSLKMGNKSIGSYDLNLCFCGLKCQELYSHLQKLLGVKHELDSGFSWSFIHRSDLLPNIPSVELSQRVECNSKLALALSVIDECFLPIIDRRSGINLIHNVVYNCGSNISRLNYSGFFTAILERGDEMISAASIRIHGTQLAEMPFIGTRHIYRRQGMCRRLLSAIESALSSIRVEKLIIPSIAEHMHTWTKVFGFNLLEESHKQEMKSINMLVFPGTDMLVKPLVKGDNIIDLVDKIATTNSSSQDPIVPLDDDSCIDVRKETLSISSPVKDDFCDGS